MANNTKKRERPEESKTDVVKGTKKHNPISSQNTEIAVHSQRAGARGRHNTVHIDFHSNIFKFSNMREFLEKVYMDKAYSKDTIVESLLLYLLQVW